MESFQFKRTKLSPYPAGPSNSRPSTSSSYFDDPAIPSFLPNSHEVEDPTRQSVQQLYNKWRAIDDEIEDDRAKKEWLQLHGSSDVGFLRAPSVAASDMSRETSHTGSITYGMEAVDLEDGVQTGKRKRHTRGGRKGALGQSSKAKAAFVRAAKCTCAECRNRKVQCTHFDSAPWEAGYQSWKAAQGFLPAPFHQSAPISPENQARQYMPNIIPEQPANPIDHELLAGIWDGQAPMIQPQGGYGDPENLLELPRTGPLPGQTAPIAIHSTPQRRPPLHLTNSMPVIPNFDFQLESVSPSTQSAKKDLPIGKFIEGPGAGWQCQYGVEGSRSGTSLTSGSSEVCQQMFPNLHDLKIHYTWQHTFFGEYEWPYLSMCVSCETYDSWPPPRDCAHCDRAKVAWEKWYHGWTVGPQSLPAEHRIRLTASQPHPTRPPYRSARGNHTHQGVFQFQGYGGGSGSGSGSGSHQTGRSHDGRSTTGCLEEPSPDPAKAMPDESETPAPDATYCLKRCKQHFLYIDPGMKPSVRSLLGRISKLWFAAGHSHFLLVFLLFPLLFYVHLAVWWSTAVEAQWRPATEPPAPPPTPRLCRLLVCCEARQNNEGQEVHVVRAAVLGDWSKRSGNGSGNVSEGHRALIC